MSTEDLKGCELYVWWKTREPASAVAAAKAVQQRLAGALPGLVAELRRRVDGRDGVVTVMEIYRRTGGLDAAARLLIATEGDADLRRWCEGPRVIEAFVPVDAG